MIEGLSGSFLDSLTRPVFQAAAVAATLVLPGLVSMDHELKRAPNHDNVSSVLAAERQE